MTDPFIDRLVSDLRPRKPLVNWRLWMHCTACLFMIIALILGFMGLRGDYISAMQTGAMFWKPGIFFLIWLGSIMLITDLSRPTGGIKKLHLVPLLLGMVILLWQLAAQTTAAPETMFKSLHDETSPYCLSIIFGSGAIALMMVWKFWYAKTASPYPALLGFVAGLSAGALAATAYALHCDRDNSLFIMVYYGLPILALAVFGGLMGRKFLKW